MLAQHPFKMSTFQIKDLGFIDYPSVLAAMRSFTQQRTPQSLDELWICEHPPVYTVGASLHHSPFQHPSIPVCLSDRGGKITYHAPGQLMVYVLQDLRRASYGIKEYVFRIEQALMKTLEHFALTSYRVKGAPGLYVKPQAPLATKACLPNLMPANWGLTLPWPKLHS